MHATAALESAAGLYQAHATAALESAAGLYQAAFSAAKVEPEQEALGPSFLGEAARRLIRYGQAVYLIEVEDGKIRLQDVGSWNIGGGPGEESWTYHCQIQGPTSAETIKVPSSGVIHFRYAVDPLRPWEGLGPLQSASATPGTLMGALEQRLGEESAAPSALLLPIPADGGDGGEGDPLANLSAARGAPCPGRYPRRQRCRDSILPRRRPRQSWHAPPAAEAASETGPKTRESVDHPVAVATSLSSQPWTPI